MNQNMLQQPSNMSRNWFIFLFLPLSGDHYAIVDTQTMVKGNITDDINEPS